MDSFDEIWKIVDAHIETEKDKISKPVTTGCLHKNVIHDCQYADIICQDCGAVVDKMACVDAEWNNYRDDSGNYSKNTQRADVGIKDNPYSIGGTVCGMFKNNKSLGAKLHLQQCFSHKQRTYWLISQVFENICSKYGLKADILQTAKNMWYMCMESGKLTRASVREGLIASCLYYSCIYNKVSISRHEILKYIECDARALTKGEKVFYSIIENNEQYRYLTKESIDIQENDAFIRYCNMLGLSWNVAMQCNDLFEKHKLKLSAVTPKSATCGIIVYIVKKKLDLKSPTKAELSSKLNVCTPTINKVVDIIVKCEAEA